jgi:hypothetical protein
MTVNTVTRPIKASMLEAFGDAIYPTNIKFRCPLSRAAHAGIMVGVTRGCPFKLLAPTDILLEQMSTDLKLRKSVVKEP